MSALLFASNCQIYRSMSEFVAPVVRSRKPRGQGASRRAEILAAASRLFLENGVEHVTMRRIAQAVGVSPTALYVYFPDKASIFLAIAEAWFAELLEVVASSQCADDPPLQRFRACIRAYVDFGLARPDAYRLTFLSPAASRMSIAACQDIPAADHSFAILQQGVEGLMAAGVFRKRPSVEAAEAAWACMHGVTALLLDQREHLETPQEVLIDTVVDLVIRGMQ